MAGAVILDLKYLITFKTILETGTFQRAAERLSYTQSTVTFQMQQLEEELSIQLFEKIGRRMALTEAGRGILPRVDAVLESVVQLGSYGKDASELYGVLRVGMPETLLTYKSQPILRAFRERAPHVKLLVHTQNCSVTRSQIINGDIDVALHYDIGGDGPSIVTKPLAEYGQALLASPRIAAGERDFITASQCKSATLISNDKNCISQEIFDRYLRSRGIFFENTMELWSIEAIKRSVISDLGVAFLPSFTAEEELRDGRLIELPTEAEPQKITALCAYHKNKWLSPALRLFLKLVDETFSSTGGLRQGQETTAHPLR